MSQAFGEAGGYDLLARKPGDSGAYARAGHVTARSMKSTTTRSAQ